MSSNVSLFAQRAQIRLDALQLLVERGGLLLVIKILLLVLLDLPGDVLQLGLLLPQPLRRLTRFPLQLLRCAVDDNKRSCPCINAY